MDSSSIFFPSFGLFLVKTDFRWFHVILNLSWIQTELCELKSLIRFSIFQLLLFYHHLFFLIRPPSRYDLRKSDDDLLLNFYLVSNPGQSTAIVLSVALLQTCRVLFHSKSQVPKPVSSFKTKSKLHLFYSISSIASSYLLSRKWQNCRFCCFYYLAFYHSFVVEICIRIYYLFYSFPIFCYAQFDHG